MVTGTREVNETRTKRLVGHVQIELEVTYSNRVWFNRVDQIRVVLCNKWSWLPARRGHV